MLSKAEEEGKVSGIKISRLSPKVTHPIYADDLVLHYKATAQEATAAISCECTGQEINWHKSSMHFNKNIPRRLKGEIYYILGISDCNHRGKYLGYPFCQFKSKATAFQDVLEKFTTKLVVWKFKALSMVGRLVLIKFVAQAIPTFIMQTFLLPKTLLERMDGKLGISFGGSIMTIHTIYIGRHETPSVHRNTQEDWGSDDWQTSTSILPSTNLRSNWLRRNTLEATGS